MAARGERVVEVDLDGRVVVVRLRRNRRAKRLILRADGTDAAVVTVPWGASYAEALDLVGRERVWLLQRLDRAPKPIPFDDGTRVPLLGVEHTIVHAPDRRGGVWLDAGCIIVTGQRRHLPRRVGEFLRKQAKAEIAPRARTMAEKLERSVSRVTVRDTRSRWGSCAQGGNLSFSWRLVLAPCFVLDYVVGHEVAHLVEANHGPQFWATVDRLVDGVDQARAWLNHHGEELHRYGKAA